MQEGPGEWEIAVNAQSDRPLVPGRGRADRCSVTLRCRLAWGPLRLDATTVDISYGGIGLELPGAQALPAPGDLMRVEIDKLGVFAVECRWRRDNRIGTRFLDEAEAEPFLEDFFDRYGVWVD